MTGNQFRMKGRNLQSYQIYLKANEYKRKSWTPQQWWKWEAGLAFAGPAWTQCPGVAWPQAIRRRPPGSCAGWGGERVKVRWSLSASLAQSWRSAQGGVCWNRPSPPQVQADAHSQGRGPDGITSLCGVSEWVPLTPESTVSGLSGTLHSLTRPFSLSVSSQHTGDFSS